MIASTFSPFFYCLFNKGLIYSCFLADIFLEYALGLSYFVLYSALNDKQS